MIEVEHGVIDDLSPIKIELHEAKPKRKKPMEEVIAFSDEIWMEAWIERASPVRTIDSSAPNDDK